MKLRFVPSMVLMASLTALPPCVMAVPQQPTVNPLAGPQKAVHDAEVNLATAKKQLLSLRKRVELSFESKPEWKTAKDNLDKAKQDFETAQRKVTASLEKNPQYKALEEKRDKAQGIIDQSHKPPAANPNGDDPVKLTDDEINAAVKDHQDAVLAMREMQKQAEESDPAYATAKQKRADAQTAWDTLQSQVDEAMKSDPGYQPATQAVDQAEQSLKSAREQLASASKALRDSEAAAAKARSTSGGTGSRSSGGRR